MATPQDVAHALTDLHETLAKRLDDAPTGVEPGYSDATGATYNPNGTVRYVRPTRPFGLLAKAIRSGSSAVNISQGSTVRLQFGTASYDPTGAVTTGASAHITVATAGWYRVDAGIFMSGVNGTYVLNDYFDLFVKRQDNNNTIATIAYENILAGLHTPAVLLQGFAYVELTAGLGVYIAAENQGSVAGNATAPTSSTDFFAVSYA